MNSGMPEEATPLSPFRAVLTTASGSTVVELVKASPAFIGGADGIPLTHMNCGGDIELLVLKVGPRGSQVMKCNRCSKEWMITVVAVAMEE